MTNLKAEDLNLMSQLLDSMDLAVKEMEKAFDKKDAERFDKSKKEILKFKLQIDEVLV